MPRRNDIQKILVNGSGSAERMKLPATRKRIFAVATGPWLRCFLGVGLLSAITIPGFMATANAMTCVSSPTIQVARIRGIVFDPFGVQVPGVFLTISREGRTVASARSDRDGKFDIRVPSGDYVIHAEGEGFLPLNQPLTVSSDIASLIHQGALRIILGLGGTTCGYATTSKRQFKKEVNNLHQRLKESV
jgi:hypothetical protein